MYKTMTIFRNIKDVEEFQRLYMEEILPEIHKLPGIVCTDVTSIQTVNSEMAGAVAGIQFLIETYFETPEQRQLTLTSPEIGKHMMQALQKTPGELYFFTGNTARVYTDEAKKKLHREDDSKSSVLDNYTAGKIESYSMSKENNGR